MKCLKDALRSATKTGGVLPVQVGRVTTKTTAKGAPYLDVEVGDCTAVASLKFWQDSQAFRVVKTDGPGFYRLGGEFFKGDYGLECTDPRLESMGDLEIEEFLLGGKDGKAKNQANMDYLDSVIGQMTVSSIRRFLSDLLGRPAVRDRFIRSAAARRNHHARRGGLLAHTTSMLRVGEAVAKCYANVVPDLLYAGIICHDLGKIVENDTADGFVPKLSMSGEMLGHINIAIEMVNRQWRESASAHPEDFAPDGGDLARQHLLHLIASHHGTKEWGSPVTPKTPEAFLLHAIDNMDAKMEMLSDVYAAGGGKDGIYDGGRLIGGSAIRPLAEALSENKQASA